jgi:hypothetical protein
MATQGWKLCKKLATIQQNISEKTNVFKTECCGSSGQFPTERMKQKVCRFLSEIRSKKSLRSCSQWSAHREIEAKKVTYDGERESDQRLEMPTCECECTEVQCTVRRVQLDLGHHCRRRHNKRYDSTGLLTVTQQLIYRCSTGLLEYTQLVWPSPGVCPQSAYVGLGISIFLYRAGTVLFL